MTIKQFEPWARENWPTVRQQLLDGTYRPGPVRRKTIPKDGGGERLLGIPNVIDRLVQQAICQVLTPIFDPDFSESSFGFRAGRSAHGATKQVQRIMRQGYAHVVDVDLSKFFDRVQHDVLMGRVSRKVRDRRLLRLIGRYLRAGVMVEGVLQSTPEGSPQGGPLSPLLSNILLDDLDQELERRGLRFVRYADDFVIFVKSVRSGQRVFLSIQRYLTQHLKLVVNQQKSRVRAARGCEYLGFTFTGQRVTIKVAPKKPLQKGLQASRQAVDRSQPGHLDEATSGRPESLLARLDRLLRSGTPVRRVCRVGRLDSSPSADVLLETVALSTHEGS